MEMQIAKLVLEYIDVLKWPGIFLLLYFLGMRDVLKKKLQELIKIDVKNQTLEFSAKVEEIPERPGNVGETMDTHDKAFSFNSLQKIAAASRKTAIVLGLDEIKNSVSVAAKNSKLEDYSNWTTKGTIRDLSERGYLESYVYDDYRRLRELRNDVYHGNFEPDDYAVLQYLRRCSELANYLRNRHKVILPNKSNAADS